MAVAPAKPAAQLTDKIEQRVIRTFGESYREDWCGTVELQIAAELHACGSAGRKFAEGMHTGLGRKQLLGLLDLFERNSAQ